MTGYTVNWVGWNSDGNHDKVWGWLSMKDGRTYCFWGRRGKKLRFKKHENINTVTVTQRQKEKKGYDYIPPLQYNVLVKDFLDEVEIWCTTAILTDTVM